MPKPQSDRVSILAPRVLRRCFAVFLIAALVFAVIVAALYCQDVLHQQIMLEQESRHVLELQQESLLVEFRAVQSDLLYLATQDVLMRFLAGDPSARGKLEDEYSSFARHKAVYDQIRCLSTSGQEIVRVNYHDGDSEVVPQSEMQSKAMRYYYQQALSLDAGEVFVSPFDLNLEHGQIEQPLKPVIRFVTPVLDDLGAKRGVLVLNYLGEHLLSKLRQLSTGFRGATMLVNQSGEYVQAPDPNHEWGWLLDHSHSFRKDFPLAWDRGKHLGTGQIRVGHDLYSFRRVSAEPDSLVLVSFVSSSVAKAHSRELLNQLMIMYAGVMLGVAVFSPYWARSGILRKYHERQIAESESRLRQLSSLLLAAQETERRNLSRDLHDELGQQVTAISLDLRSLEKKAGNAAPDELLQRAIHETDQLLKSLHKIATRVRPSVLDDLGLREAIESLISEYQQRTGISVNAELRFHRDSFPATIGENVYRILQEALTNVASHAHVSQVEVSIESNSDLLRMTIRDSGAGFEPETIMKSARLGLLGMRERVELLNGCFEVESAISHGTHIRVTIPLDTNEQ